MVKNLAVAALGAAFAFVATATDMEHKMKVVKSFTTALGAKGDGRHLVPKRTGVRFHFESASTFFSKSPNEFSRSPIDTVAKIWYYMRHSENEKGRRQDEA